MKKNIVLLLLSCFVQSAVAQNINWESLTRNDRQMLTVNAGWEYGMVFGGSYGYQLKSSVPVMLTASFSLPAGNHLLDDFKATFGGLTRVYRVNHFHFSAGGFVLYRRYENPLLRLHNIGAAVTGIAGYYKPKWFMAAELGFDKAIATHFRHSDSFRENVYAGARDGWYKPSTGGNLSVGLQTGYTIGQHEITLKGGRTITEHFSTAPLVPYYLQLAYGLRIAGR